MEPGASAPARPRSNHTPLAVGVLVTAVAGFLFVLYAFASSPKPPAPGTVSKPQAQARMAYEAQLYASAVNVAARTGALTEDRLLPLDVPQATGVGTPRVSTRGETTVVTFPVHKAYGEPTGRQQVTACYRMTLTATAGGMQQSSFTSVAESVCTSR